MDQDDLNSILFAKEAIQDGLLDMTCGESRDFMSRALECLKEIKSLKGEKALFINYPVTVCEVECDNIEDIKGVLVGYFTGECKQVLEGKENSNVCDLVKITVDGVIETIAARGLISQGEDIKVLRLREGWSFEYMPDLKRIFDEVNFPHETCILRKDVRRGFFTRTDTVICGQGIAEHYLRQGYYFDWEATDESRKEIT